MTVTFGCDRLGLVAAGRCGVVVGAGVAVEVAVGEQVPGGDDHGVFDSDDGAHGSAAGGDAFVFGGEVGVLRACRRECGDSE